MRKKIISNKKKLLEWRAKQKPGTIMSPETFKKIEASAGKNPKYDNPAAVAGKAYWTTAKAKFKEAQAKKRKRVKSGG